MEPSEKMRRIEEASGEVEEAEATQTLAAVNQFQKQLDTLDEECVEEIVRIEARYVAQRRPLYEKRGDLLAAIPDFWLTVFMNHETMKQYLKEADCAALKYCTRLVVTENEDIKSGYQVELVFKSNPYFENYTLVKGLFIDTSSGDITRAGTSIQWKPNMDITQPSEKREQERKRPREEDDASFFEWFSELNEDDALGDLLKDEIWPNPLQYFQGEIMYDEADAGDEEDMLEGLDRDDDAMDEDLLVDEDVLVNEHVAGARPSDDTVDDGAALDEALQELSEEVGTGVVSAVEEENTIELDADLDE